MQRRRLALVVLLGALAASVSIASFDVNAQPKRAAQRAAKKPARKSPAPKPNKEAASAAEDDDVEEPAKPVSSAAAGTQGAPRVLDIKEQGDAGIKTYKFGPVEVEGRLKSPQIVYFLRRVRAEFAAGALGHRSFMGELSDTRRSPALK